MTLSLATNSNYPDGQIWKIVLGSEGTNVLNLTPTNFSAGTADKIHRSTNIMITAGTSLEIQKLGTNFNIIGGLPTDPIGTIKAWDKNAAGTCTNLPSFWVECNGQTLSDAGSPLNGKVIPDLNNTTNRFLRGNVVTAGVGGQILHVHTYSGTTDPNSGSQSVTHTTDDVTVASDGHSHAFSGTTQEGGSAPPYYDITWIKRVK